MGVGGGRSLNVDKNYIAPLLDLVVGLKKIVEFDALYYRTEEVNI